MKVAESKNEYLGQIAALLHALDPLGIKTPPRCAGISALQSHVEVIQFARP